MDSDCVSQTVRDKNFIPKRNNRISLSVCNYILSTVLITIYFLFLMTLFNINYLKLCKVYNHVASLFSIGFDAAMVYSGLLVGR